MFWRTLILPTVLYFALRTAFANYWLPTGPLRWWFADLLALPVILSLGLLGTRVLTRKPALWLPLPVIVSTTLAVSVVFEVWLPTRNHVYTADWVDALMYVIGAGYFFWEQRRSQRQLSTAMAK